MTSYSKELSPNRVGPSVFSGLATQQVAPPSSSLSLLRAGSVLLCQPLWFQVTQWTAPLLPACTA